MLSEVQEFEYNKIKEVLESFEFRSDYKKLLASKNTQDPFSFAANTERLLVRYSDSYFITNKNLEDKNHAKDSVLGDFSHQEGRDIHCFDLKCGEAPRWLGAIHAESIRKFRGDYVCINSNVSELLIVSAEFIRACINGSYLQYDLKYTREKEGKSSLRYLEKYNGYEVIKNDPSVFYTKLSGIEI